MKYFCSNKDREGSCYIEFSNITNEEFWNDDSMFIEDELMGEIGLTKVIKEVVPSFDPYGAPITINQMQWLRIKEAAENEELCWEALKEIDAWAEDNLRQNQTFKILGV